ncbi:hypothetical protein HIM_07821 [Hirsutella minnesotensis 3608]|uniref:Amine oxidase domain-containing protein n=1 Tax=Hirsutella minnesotensis 3608 TaxID=1043627 RepID=A0A0F7ZHJ4_9HYPO|nr:hypothetical protein HIM_07821 [Hirsutella minnesotensis 3608]
MRLAHLLPSICGTSSIAAAVFLGSAAAWTESSQPREKFMQKILSRSFDYGGCFNCSVRSSGEPRIGVIGAGITGLYAAILLDSLNIDYELLESSNRIGGRIFTYRFNETAWKLAKPGEPDYYDYYDVGAMRFPVTPWMDRVLGKANNSLVSYVNSKLKPHDQPITIIPYIFEANNTFRLFNDRLTLNQDSSSAATFNVLISEGGSVENSSFSQSSPDAMFSDPISPLVDLLRHDFDTGFNALMKYDDLSVRQYFLQKGYSSPQIDWLETIKESTTHYDTYSLSEAVIDEFIFNEAPHNNWVCVEGGMDRIVEGISKIINKPAETGKRVTAIKPAENNDLKVIVNKNEARVYSHVINTASLGAMQVMNMHELNLDYRKKLAIRKLQYDPAGKIGMKFKTRWWENLHTGGFQGGQSFSDLPIRRTVYPSYGLGVAGAPGVMIASYTWGQDSARLGAYYNDAMSRESIIDITLQNLAAMHNVSYDHLRSQYVDSHLWNWSDGEDIVGAYAIFGPGEYSSVLPALLMPAAGGRLHFAGDALSSGHAWITGALNSAYRSVAEILASEGMEKKLSELIDLWGLIGEVDMGWYSSQTSQH